MAQKGWPVAPRVCQIDQSRGRPVDEEFLHLAESVYSYFQDAGANKIKKENLATALRSLGLIISFSDSVSLESQYVGGITHNGFVKVAVARRREELQQLEGGETEIGSNGTGISRIKSGPCRGEMLPPIVESGYGATVDELFNDQMIRKSLQFSQAQMRELVECFLVLDPARCGRVATDDLRQLLTCLGEELTAEDVHTLLAIDHLQHSQTLTCAQFLKLMSIHKQTSNLNVQFKTKRQSL
eukprot:GHVT01099212.1.p1 GENE.GHVT01099212.1~~GHVT01099212.1.p1  ORF type:complete len:241 (-),score=24.66 GHVT01099212.1:68-790(-)